jgi:hypothetical protein
LADEPNVTAEPEAPAVEQAADAPEPAAAEQPEVDWDALQSQLETAYERDPRGTMDRLKKHRAVGGLAGSIAERQLAQLKQQDDAQRQASAAQSARDELRKMAQEQPLQFADMFLSHDDAEEARNRILSVETNAQKQILTQVGEAFHEFEEWGTITDEERTRLAHALEGVAPNKLIAVFNKTALDIVADRRADKRLQDRLPKEQEAWKKQWEAERLTAEQGPDLRRPSSTTRRRLNWAAMDDKDFNDLWRQRYGR